MTRSVLTATHKHCALKLPMKRRCLNHAGGDPDDEEDEPRDGAVEVNMTVDESGDVSMLSGEVHKWFTLHAELPSEARMDPALLVANTHILFNPKRGDIKVGRAKLSWLPVVCCPSSPLHFPLEIGFEVAALLSSGSPA